MPETLASSGPVIAAALHLPRHQLVSSVLASKDGVENNALVNDVQVRDQMLCLVLLVYYVYFQAELQTAAHLASASHLTMAIFVRRSVTVSEDDSDVMTCVSHSLYRHQ